MELLSTIRKMVEIGDDFFTGLFRFVGVRETDSSRVRLVRQD